MLSQRFLISGKVQGVFYRQSTLKKAQELGITGWVRNLKDGRVEAIACGNEDAMRKFHNWLWQGPENAKVEEVITQTIASESFKDFTIK